MSPWDFVRQQYIINRTSENTLLLGEVLTWRMSIKIHIIFFFFSIHTVYTHIVTRILLLYQKIQAKRQLFTVVTPQVALIAQRDNCCTVVATAECWSITVYNSVCRAWHYKAVFTFIAESLNFLRTQSSENLILRGRPVSIAKGLEAPSAHTLRNDLPTKYRGDILCPAVKSVIRLNHICIVMPCEILMRETWRIWMCLIILFPAKCMSDTH